MPKEQAETTQIHHFGAEVSKVLQLMIHALYTNKDIFLRELISNASDACDKLRYQALTHPELLQKGEAGQHITISVDKTARTLTITDTGIGMSAQELVDNLGTIAKSGTQEFLNQLTGDNKRDLPLIGQFGVGFYASFMVAEQVTVISTKAGSGESWQWQSDGNGQFTIAAYEPQPHGTRITLLLKSGEDEYLDSFRVRHIIQTYSDHISFPITLVDEQGEKQSVNTASALWTRPKAEISEEQYTEFYHHVAHMPDTPWLTLHNKAEGKLDYTALLFIPASQPFDLFHPDRMRRVKLYVKRVFITDQQLDLIPHYLRFMRGIIDSQDLPLNISRETLQHNPLVKQIQEAVVKRVLSELKKTAASDPDSYAGFWKNFGAVLKEGLCEGYSPREPILEVCRFQSTASDALTGLDDYIARFKEGQEEIFYLTGERLETLQNSAQIEGFKQRGIEVLLLTDHVDDFWVNVVFDYKGKKFKSVTRSDIDLDQVATPPEHTAPSTDIMPLIERIKTILGSHVQDVRTSHKLTNSAVCLAVSDAAMDFRLEKFLLEQKQLSSATAKILEVNPHHPIIQSLTNAANIEDAVWLLFDQACILEGQNVVDAAAFSQRISSFLEKGLLPLTPS